MKINGNPSFIIRCLSLVCALAFAGVVQAAPVSWALVNTEVYSGDILPSTEKAASVYSAYLCTVETAQTLFGGDGSIATVTSYLKNNFATGLGKLAKDGTPLNEGDYDLGQYTFANHGLSSALAGDYLAVITYENGDDKAVRVFQNAAVEGNVVFDDQSGYVGGTFGAWTTVGGSVPEPTSGLLLLLGLAGLALRRKTK